jgi:hypothetical protein
MSSTDERPWTVLVYMVADHKGGGLPLDKFAEKELRSIIGAASLTDMHVAVQVDFTERRGTFRGTVISEGKGTDVEALSSASSRPRQAKLIKKIVEKDKAITLHLERGPETNAADPNVLRDFLRWAQTECPAQRYAIFFWGHSFGPMGLFFDNRPGSSAARLGLSPFGVALEELKQPADVVLFKDCLMNTFEMAYQIQDVAKYAVGSQALVPIRGEWPYTDLFAILQTATHGNQPLVARALAARLGTYYDSKENRAGMAEVPMSLLDLSKVESITQPLVSLVEALQDVRLDPRRVNAVSRAFERARAGRGIRDLHHPGDPSLLDVPRLCDNLLNLENTPVADAARDLGDAMRLNKIITWEHSQKNTFTGIGIYYTSLNLDFVRPPTPLSVIEPAVLSDPETYESLALNAKTKWGLVALEPIGTASLPNS